MSRVRIQWWETTQLLSCWDYWWSTAEHCDFHLFISHLHVECNWEPDNHLPHLHRLSPENCHVLFPAKFLLHRNLIYIYLHSQIIPGDKTIAYNNFISQIFFADLFGVTEFFLLATVSYNWYMAVCNPLHYMTIMNNMVCRRLILCCWMAGLFIIIPPLSLGLHLEFCDSNVIDHFFCDAVPLLKISCSETWLIKQMIIVCAVLTFIMTLLCVVLSYIHIIKTILQFSSAQQRKKAFFTCSSHLIVVSVTYGSSIFIYVKPSAKDSAINKDSGINKGVTMLTTSIAPMLNPFIYTLRNKQVKQAFGDAIKRIALFSKI